MIALLQAFLEPSLAYLSYPETQNLFMRSSERKSYGKCNGIIADYITELNALPAYPPTSQYPNPPNCLAITVCATLVFAESLICPLQTLSICRQSAALKTIFLLNMSTSSSMSASRKSGTRNTKNTPPKTVSIALPRTAASGSSLHISTQIPYQTVNTASAIVAGRKSAPLATASGTQAVTAPRMRRRSDSPRSRRKKVGSAAITAPPPSS